MGDERERNGNVKVTGIRQIVRLKEILHKWQSITLSSRNPSPPREKNTGGISPAINRRLKSSYILCDSDEESCQSPEPPPDVPKGYLAVYVGPELRRFIIPTSYLSHEVFKVLLEKTEEEFGFDHKGALTLPCDAETFKFLVQCIRNKPNSECSSGSNSENEDESENEEINEEKTKDSRHKGITSHGV